jgi:hypothetical protein
MNDDDDEYSVVTVKLSNITEEAAAGIRKVRDVTRSIHVYIVLEEQNVIRLYLIQSTMACTTTTTLSNL